MTPELEVIIGARITELINGLNRAGRAVRDFGRQSDRTTDDVEDDFDEAGQSLKKFGNTADDVFKGVIKGMAAAFSVNAIINFGQRVLEITGQFQKLRAVLSNTLGSQAIADLRLEQLQEFASQTPFGVSELTEAFVKLSNQGFTPTIKQIRQLGDLASSTGKSFDQLAEAIIDAQVGEYERLKEFGVRAKDAGDSVIFTFKGVATEVEKTSTAIREYLTSLGDAEGVTGSMAAISETLEGQISNLQDSYDALLVSVGNNTQGAFSTAIEWVNNFINRLRDMNEEIEITQKYGIGGYWWQGLNRALNPFSDKGITDAEKSVIAIQSVTKWTNEFIDSINSGAKSTEDFSKGITTIQRAIEATRKEGRSFGETQGMVAEYVRGIQALLDLQRQFEENANKAPDANFGAGGTGKTEAQKAAEQLQKAIQDETDKSYINARSGRDKEIAEVEVHYRKLIELAQGKSEEISKLETLQAENLAQINAKYDSEELKDAQKLADDILKNNERVQIAIRADRDREIEEARIRYEKLYDLAKANSELMILIAEQESAEVNAINKKWDDKDLEDKRKRDEKLIKQAEETAKKIAEAQMYVAQQFGDIFGNVLEDVLMDGENVFQALGREFKRMIIRMIADAVALKAANIFQGLMNNSSSGKSGGSWGAWIGTALNIVSKFLGGSGGGGGGATASMNTMSMPIAASGFSSLDLSANSFSSGTSISGMAGIPVYVSGEFVQRGRDLHAVVKSAEQDGIRFYGK